MIAVLLPAVRLRHMSGRLIARFSIVSNTVIFIFICVVVILDVVRSLHIEWQLPLIRKGRGQRRLIDCWRAAPSLLRVRDCKPGLYPNMLTVSAEK